MTEIIMAIDPAAAHHRWIREFEWHLDVVPAIMDALVEATLPKIPVSRGGSRFDKIQITGGGHIDNMALLDHFDVTSDGAMVPKGAAADARELWEWVSGYTEACSAWLNRDVYAPWAADLPPVAPQVNPDPLTARSIALVTVGWLIDHAEPISEITELDEHRNEMFRLIRHLRGRYGVFNAPRRRPPELCVICGEIAVRSHWVSGTTGPRSVEVRRCSTCGDETREEAPAEERQEITEVDGKPVQAKGGVSEADRTRFAELLRTAREKRDR
ncbi:hypothetical protein PFZ55_41125 [Streptomyces sp. MS2A]|nr:hypothetical protein [Streptomyces sp. MS2A]